MLVRTTYVDYTPEWPDDVEDFDPSDLTVRLTGRSADGERIVRYIEGVRPQTFEDPASASTAAAEQYVTAKADGYESYDGRPLCRVDLAHPDLSSGLEEDADYTYEADIPFYRRATWSYGLSGYIRVPHDDTERRVHIEQLETDIETEAVDDPIDPRVVIGDIEVFDEESRSFDEMKEAADAPIIAATWFDTYDEEYEVQIVDPDGAVEGSEIREHLREHWGEHDLAEDYAERSDVDLVIVDSETDLLKKTIAYFQRKRPDLVSGWNFVDFDWYYILERLKACSDDNVYGAKLSDIGGVSRYQMDRDLSIQKAVDGLPAVDQMVGYCDKMSFGEWASQKLEYVAMSELGIGKIDEADVAEAYQQNRTRMTAYNLLDVQLCVEMSRRYAIENFLLTLGDMCRIQIYDTFSEKREVDGYIGSRREADEVLPNQTEEEIETPAGGLVLSPSKGVQEDVAVFDLKSLYPSSMLTMNISPETMCDLEAADVVIPGMPEKEDDVGGSIEPSDINWENDDPALPWSQRPKGFTLEERGIMPKYVEKLFKEREKFKALRNQHPQGSVMYDVYDRRQAAIKVIMNSFYGVSNSKYYRLAKDGIGDAITGVSRYVNWRAAEFIESLGYTVPYGDTDSVFVQLTEEGEDKSKEELILDAKGIANQLNDHMATVADDLGLPLDHPLLDVSDLPHDLRDGANHCWFFEFEKLYERFIQCGTKKRYAGVLCHKDGEDVDKTDITGFEAERSDVMERTQRVQRTVIEKVLSGDDFTAVSEYVREEIEQVTAAADDLHEIGIPSSLSKPLEGPGSYGNLPRARAARFSNKHLGYDFGPGDDPWRYYVSRTPAFMPETDVVALEWSDELPEDFELNKTKTVEKAFESALKPIVEEVGWTFNEVREGKRNQPAADDSVMSYSGDPWAEEETDSMSKEEVVDAFQHDPTEESADGSDDEDAASDPLGGAGAW